MAKKTKLCKYCRSEIDKKARVCPHCQKKQGTGCGTLVLFCIIVAIGFSVAAVKLSESGGTSTSSSNVESEIILESEYRKTCKSVPYETIARAKDGLKGERLTFTGEIIQATSGKYRMNVTKGEYFYTDTIVFDINENKLSENILEGDIVTIWGESEGLYTYKSVLKTEVTVPRIEVAFIERNE